MRYEKSYFDKLVASLPPLLEKRTTGKAAEFLSPDYLDMADPGVRGGAARQARGGCSAVMRRVGSASL